METYFKECDYVKLNLKKMLNSIFEICPLTYAPSVINTNNHHIVYLDLTS